MIVIRSTLLLFGAILVIKKTEGYEIWRGNFEVDGYCHVENLERIKVGQTFYNDKNCQEIVCMKWTYLINGCSIEDKEDECRLVRGTGHYPNCCPQVVCNTTTTLSAS